MTQKFNDTASSKSRQSGQQYKMLSKSRSCTPSKLMKRDQSKLSASKKIPTRDELARFTQMRKEAWERESPTKT